MHIENHNHIHYIMQYHFEKGWKAVESFHHLNKLFDKVTISISQVKRLFKWFKTSDTNLGDQEGRE